MPGNRIRAFALSALVALFALFAMETRARAAEPAATPAGDPASIASISAACAFVLHHQQPDGSWSDASSAAADPAWGAATTRSNDPSSTLFSTALCLQALAARPMAKDTTDAATAQAMARAVAWLVAGQDEAGALSPRSAEQAAATAALVAAARAHVPGSDAAATRATAVLLDRQRMLGEPPRTAWAESIAVPDVIDTSASMWSLLALNDNPAARGTAIEDAMLWLAQTYDVANAAIVPDAGNGALAPPALFPGVWRWPRTARSR